MTWLPVEAGDRAERDAVFGLVPEPYEVVRRALAAMWRIADPRTLDLCRLRLAQLTEARAELADADEELLAELAAWEASELFTAAERAALAFAEQYHYDHSNLGESHRAELARHLSPGEVVNFVWALHLNDSYIRLLRLLDVAPDPVGTPRPERRPAPEGPVAIDPSPVKAPVWENLYREVASVVVRQSRVDDVTSEAIRLHNASYQHCAY